MLPTILPHLVANDGVAALRLAIADPQRYIVEPKVDGVRGLLTFAPDHVVESRNRHGARRDWLRGDEFEAGRRRLAARLPLLWEGTVLDGEALKREADAAGSRGRLLELDQPHVPGAAHLVHAEREHVSD